MTFGLHSAPATFQRLLDGILEPNVLVYLDDIIIISQTFEDHLRRRCFNYETPIYGLTRRNVSSAGSGYDTWAIS